MFSGTHVVNKEFETCRPFAVDAQYIVITLVEAYIIAGDSKWNSIFLLTFL